MDEKYAFLELVTARMAALVADGRLAVVAGDLNIAHRNVDIKNWKGNLKSAGFLPEERAYVDRWLDELGWHDLGRELGGEGPGPYTWWSWRGKAFDNDSGWRIDYQLATPALAGPREVRRRRARGDLRPRGGATTHRSWSSTTCRPDRESGAPPARRGSGVTTPSGTGSARCTARRRRSRTVPASSSARCGGGNHFIELCTDADDVVRLQLHSGSRNIGTELAEHHAGIAKRLNHDQGLVDRDLAVFLAGTRRWTTTSTTCGGRRSTRRGRAR